MLSSNFHSIIPEVKWLLLQSAVLTICCTRLGLAADDTWSTPKATPGGGIVLQVAAAEGEDPYLAGAKADSALQEKMAGVPLQAVILSECFEDREYKEKLLVQIAPYQYGSENPLILAEFWEAQADALSIPNTGMVVINDIGNIEFWSNNYGPLNSGKVPNASPNIYDFGDQPSIPDDGYGCVQVHNCEAKQTLFALNNWKQGPEADIGIGNSTGKTRDWTFNANAKTYTAKRLRILVRMKQ